MPVYRTCGVIGGRARNERKIINESTLTDTTNFKGDVDRVAVPLEPKVPEIVFNRRPDAKPSDPAYLQRFVGVYELAGQEVTFALQGVVLTLTVPG